MKANCDICRFNQLGFVLISVIILMIWEEGKWGEKGWVRKWGLVMMKGDDIVTIYQLHERQNVTSFLSVWPFVVIL